MSRERAPERRGHSRGRKGQRERESTVQESVWGRDDCTGGREEEETRRLEGAPMTVQARLSCGVDLASASAE